MMFRSSAMRLTLAVALGIGAPLAHAHAIPKIQQPGPGATVNAPHEVSIEFGEGLEPNFSSIIVTTEAGTQVSKEKSSVDASDRKHMSVPLPALDPGVYTVQWKAFAADGHRTQGHYNFTVK
jgi:copper resistance protein C